MPAVNPRLNVSFQPKTYQAVKAISVLTGQSMSSVVGSMIESQSVVLQQLAQALSEARYLEKPISGSMQVKLSFGEQAAEIAEGQAQEALDTLLEVLRTERASQADKRALRRAQAGA